MSICLSHFHPFSTVGFRNLIGHRSAGISHDRHRQGMQDSQGDAVPKERRGVAEKIILIHPDRLRLIV